MSKIGKKNIVIPKESSIKIEGLCVREGTAQFDTVLMEPNLESHLEMHCPLAHWN